MLSHVSCHSRVFGIMDSMVERVSQKVISARRPRAGAPKLFCFPFAGGSARSLSPLGDRLPAWLDTRYVELPGRGARSDEDLVTDMDQMVKELADDLAPMCSGPFAFYGHSMGAILAYRTAILLGERYKLNPQLLIVSGARAPHLPRTKDALHTLPDAQLVPRLERMGGTETGVLRDHELREITLRIIRADFKMLDEASLLAVNPLPCPILAFGGDHDAFVDQEGVEGWRFHTNTKFRCHFFHGRHFFIWDSMNEIAKNIIIEVGYMCRGKARVV